MLERAATAAWAGIMAVAFLDNVANVKRVKDVSVPPLIIDSPAAASQDLCLVASAMMVGKPVPGDLVAFASPFDPRTTVVKRLVAREDDVVRKVPGDWRYQSSERIRPGFVWVEGGQAADMDDSRSCGQLQTSLLRGKVVGILRFQLAFPIVSVVWA